MAQKDKIKELVGRGLNSYHTKSLQQIDRIEKKNKEQNYKISILSNELDNDYLTKTEEGSVISLEHSKEGMVYLDELQGNTLVNYCTDGSKEMTLNGDIDVEGTFVTTTEGVDNGKVDVMCEGNTLVNSILTFNTTQGTGWTKTDNTYNFDETAAETKSNGLVWNVTGIKPNVKYSFIYTCTQNSLVNKVRFHNDVGHYIANVSTYFMSNIGINVITFTTKATLLATETKFKISVNMDQVGTGRLSIKDVMIIEGDWTNKEIPSYFEGMKSVGECEDNKIEILSQNKNLFAFNENKPIDLIEGYCESIPIYNNGTIYVKPLILNESTPSSYRNGYINTNSNDFIFKPFTSYKISVKLDIINNPLNLSVIYAYPRATNMTTLYYNSNTERYEGICSDEYDYSDVASNANANNRLEFRFCGIECNVSEIMVQEYEDTSTTYVPYSLNKKEILLNEPLRGLPSGIKDRFVKIGGKPYIERNCGCKDLIVVSGSRWEDNAVADGMIGFYDILSMGNNYNGSGSVVEIAENIVCDKLPSIGRKDLERTTYDAIIRGNTYIGITVKADKLETQDFEGFKKYINSLNAKFIYNLATPIYEPLEIDPTINTYNDITHISNNSIIPCNMIVKNTGYNAIIKPSTLYTVALDTNKSGTIGMNLGGVKGTTTNNVLKLTTPATLADDSLRLYGKGINASKVRLLEGDKTNWISSYFEGMKSSFEDKLQDDGTYKMEILSNNKNLLDVEENLTFDTKTILINLKKGRYTVSFKSISGHSNGIDFTMAFYNDKNLVTYFTVRNGKTFNLDFDCDIVYLYSNGYNWAGSQGKLITVNTLQITRGNIVLDAEIKKSNKIQFSSIEPLRKWDRFVFKDNKLMIERNSIERIMNHTIQYGKYNVEDNGYFSIVANFEDIENSIGQYTCENNKLQSHSKYADLYYGKAQGVFCGNRNVQDGSVVIGLPNRIATSINDAKLWLQNNPITVVYKSKEPTYEEIPYELQKIILEGYENGTLFFDTNIPPTSTVTYAGETPIVKATKLNKTEVLSNTNDINENIIPYLMDMDYRVVCLQLQSEEFNDGIAMARLFGGAYEMLQRDIQSKRYSIDEYRHRLDAYLDANKITEEEYNKLGDMLNE